MYRCGLLGKVKFRRKIEKIDTTTERVVVCVTCTQLVWVENKKNQNFKLNSIIDPVLCISSERGGSLFIRFFFKRLGPNFQIFFI